MGFSEELTLSLLARVNDIDMNLAAPTTNTLFTFPSGFGGFVSHVIIKPAASGFTTLAAAVDVDLGKSGAPTDWANAATFAALINADLCLILKSPEIWEVASPVYDAGEIFQMVVNTGAVAGALIDAFVYGSLFVP